jgi:hypothetical protein
MPTKQNDGIRVTKLKDDAVDLIESSGAKRVRDLKDGTYYEIEYDDSMLSAKDREKLSHALDVLGLDK